MKTKELEEQVELRVCFVFGSFKFLLVLLLATFDLRTFIHWPEKKREREDDTVFLTYQEYIDSWKVFLCPLVVNRIGLDC